MDDRKVFELKRLELAYDKQLIFMAGLILFSLLGAALYIVNLYDYSLQSLLISIVVVVVGITGIFSVDTRMREINRRIRGL